MPQTPDTSSSAYATSTDLVNHYDERVLCQLVSDTGTAEDASALASNAKVLAALKTASGRVEASALRGGRYRPADLTALTGVAREYLVSLVCHLAFEELRRRRPDVQQEASTAYDDAREDLKALTQGEILFPTLEAQAAGLPDSQVNTARQVEARRMTSYTAERYYGRRSNRLGPY